MDAASGCAYALDAALGTQQVLFTKEHSGFMVAIPVGLLVSAVFAAASAVRRTPEKRTFHFTDAVIAFVAVKTVDSGGCLDNRTELGNRMTRLHNAFVQTYNTDFKTINACDTVDCESAPKRHIAAALKTYNDGLGAICWPDRGKADATALINANTALADAYTTWATATNDAEDQSRGNSAREQDARQSTADDILARDLGVPSASGTT